MWIADVTEISCDDCLLHVKKKPFSNRHMDQGTLSKLINITQNKFVCFGPQESGSVYKQAIVAKCVEIPHTDIGTPLRDMHIKFIRHPSMQTLHRCVNAKGTLGACLYYLWGAPGSFAVLSGPFEANPPKPFFELNPRLPHEAIQGKMTTTPPLSPQLHWKCARVSPKQLTCKKCIINGDCIMEK